MDYVILSLGSHGDFRENGVDLLPERQLFLEKSYLEGLEIVSDSASSSMNLNKFAHLIFLMFTFVNVHHR